MSRLKPLLSILPPLCLQCVQLSNHTDKTFPKFDKLPVEVRCMIWHLATSKPNNIPLVNYFNQQPAVAQWHLPGVLLACHESRKETQKFYTKVTEQRLVHWHSEVFSRISIRTIYINFAVD
ncbi:hypothetical protein N431DRAFT_447159 [Stipitochalara longipes BDJ]|nr:hypothetical protein N431DRAFT_447159 [Stipitochalara longipes BDJ]